MPSWLTSYVQLNNLKVNVGQSCQYKAYAVYINISSIKTMRQIKKLIMPRIKVIKQNRRLQQLTAALTIVIVVAIGTYLLSGARAQSPYVAIGADSGTLGGSATIQSNTSATDGKYIQFGSQSASSTFSTMVGEITSPIQGNAWWPSEAQFSSWMGRKVDVIGDYMNLGGTWGYIDGDSSSDLSADAGQISANPGTLLELSVPMLPSSTYPLNPQGSSSITATDTSGLEDGAAGDFDTYYQTLAQNLINDDLSNTIIRLGEESNGGWAPWSCYLDESAFVQYFDNVVTTMKSVSGENFLFDFNGATGVLPNGDSSMNCYPGNNYVNFIGGDYYDASNAISIMYTGTNQLDALASFCVANNKLIDIGEFGLVAAGNTGLGADPGGDDPAWFQDIYNFAINPADRLGIVTYFNQSPSGADSAIVSELPGNAYNLEYFPTAIPEFLNTFGKLPPGKLPAGW